MNDLQKVQLELLKLFIDICEKLELRYFLVCGSALGAVKYGGFIPWDDDIDVALPREDYDCFIEKAPSFLPESVFLQNYRTDPEFPLIFSKLRDSRTTFIESCHAKKKINHGVYIDVFPLDGYPFDSVSQHVYEKRKAHFERKRSVVLDYPRFKYPWAIRSNLAYAAYRLFGYGRDVSKTIGDYESFLRSYPSDKSDIWCNHGNWQGKLEYAPRSQYGEGVRACFEGVEVIVPERFDAYLTQKYGCWKDDPPASRQKSHHDFLVIDLSRSYLDYLEEKEGE